jgi:hypothetical protein
MLNYFRKSNWLAAALSVFMLLGCITPTLAFDKDRDDRKCQKQMQKAEQNLQKAVRKHGEHSRQAEDRRRQLQEVRERCHRGDRDHDRDHDHH